MRIEQRLRAEAREAAKFRGHRMERNWDVSEFWGEKIQSITCLDCGMQVFIDLKPAPNGIDLYGEAIALNCKDKK